MADKMFRVRAWGHATAPDLDYEADADDREWLYRNYPHISIALQIPASYAPLKQALAETPSE